MVRTEDLYGWDELADRQRSAPTANCILRTYDEPVTAELFKL